MEENEQQNCQQLTLSSSKIFSEDNNVYERYNDNKNPSLNIDNTFQSSCVNEDTGSNSQIQTADIEM